VYVVLCYNEIVAVHYHRVKGYSGMHIQQQVQQPENLKSISKQPPPGYIFIAAVTFSLFAFGIGSGLLSIAGILHGSLFTILAVVFTVLGIVFAFFLWLFPYTFHPTEYPRNYYLTSTVPVERNVFRPQSLPVEAPPVNVHVFRDIVGLPPPTIPKTIQQRTGAVEDIYRHLVQQDVNAIVLTGIGGEGKSTLAALIYRFVEEERRKGSSFFTGKSIWMRVDSNVTIADLAGTLFEALGEPIPDLNQLSPRDGAMLLFQALNNVEKPRLVILDQFESLLDVQTGSVLEHRPGVGEWLDILNSQQCTCRVLLTSRLWPQGTHKYPPTYLQEYFVRGLEMDEGVELLRKQGVEESQASKMELQLAIQHCDGHAMALTLLASLLRRDRSLNLSNFLADSIYTQLWEGDIARNLLDYIYNEQLDPVQRRLLLAFSVYRDSVPWEAAHSIIPDISKSKILPALEVLVAQHLLVAEGEGRYQLHAIVESFARSHFVEQDEQADQQSYRVAHSMAAQYYLQQATKMCPPREERRGSNDVQLLLEAIWHQCQAEQWQDAYDLMERQGIFDDLKRWGTNDLLLNLYQLLLPLAKQHPKSAQSMCIYSNLGRVYRTLGKREQAREYLEIALGISRDIRDRAGEGAMLSFLGSVYDDLGLKEQALDYLQQALKIRQEVNDRGGEGWTLDNIGRIYDDLGKEELAIKYLEQALKIRMEVNDRIGEERTLNTLGRVYDNLGRKELAGNYYKQALTICQEIGDRVGEGSTLNYMGLFYADRGQIERAIELFEEALEIRKEVGDRGGVGRTLNNLGRVYRILGQYERAQEFLEQALKVCVEVEDRLGEGKVYNNLGILYQIGQQNEQALKYFEQALGISIEVKDRSGEAWALHNLGRVHADLGQIEQASKYFKQALDIRREVGERRGEGWTLYNIGKLYFERGLEHYGIALACFLPARKMFDEVQSPDFVRPQQNIEKMRETIGEERFASLSAQIEPLASQIVEQALREEPV
jgi:tetratricopeptide (TPR) repeat protein